MISFINNSTLHNKLLDEISFRSITYIQNLFIQADISYASITMYTHLLSSLFEPKECLICKAYCKQHLNFDHLSVKIMKNQHGRFFLSIAKPVPIIPSHLVRMRGKNLWK